MSQSPITQFFSPTKSTRPSVQKHQDSPRPAADNLIYHALKRIKLQDDQDSQVSAIKTENLIHKVPSPRRDSHTKYTAAERMDALEQVSLHGLTITSRRLNIPCSTLATWRKDILVGGRGIVTARSPLKGKRSKTSAQKLTFGDTESDDLSTWLSNLRINKKSVTFEDIKVKIQKKHGEEAFKAKRGWLTEFMTKHGVTLDQRSRNAVADSDRDIRQACVVSQDNLPKGDANMSEIDESEYFSLR